MSTWKFAFIWLITSILGTLPMSACVADGPSATQPANPIATVPQQTAETTEELAQVCVPNPACSPPDIHDTEPGDTYCVRKIPYQNFSVTAGAIVEPVEPSSGLKCENSGVIDRDGKVVWACTGQQLYPYRVKITNPNCQAQTLLPNSGRCQESYGYDSTQDCCALFDTPSSGYVIITVNMGACP